MSQILKIINIVCLCITNDQGQVYLVQKSRDPFIGTWGIPGGKLQYGETIYDGMMREIKEEIGYIPLNTSLLGVFEFFDLGHIIVHVYHTYLDKQHPQFIFDYDEIAGGGWYDIQSLLTENDIELTPNHITVLQSLYKHSIDN